MFGFFKKKGEIYLKDNQAAFEMSCSMMHNDLELGAFTLAMVLSEPNEHRECVVKLANADSPHVPKFPVECISSLDSDPTVCTNAIAIDRIKSLKPGDLVMYTPNNAFVALGCAMNRHGFLAMKVKPIYSRDKNMWIEDRS